MRDLPEGIDSVCPLILIVEKLFGFCVTLVRVYEIIGYSHLHYCCLLLLYKVHNFKPLFSLAVEKGSSVNLLESQ